jgi:PAS domain S-box-containing protein
MLSAPLHPDEPARLQALRQLGVLDTPAEPAFDALVRAASLLCEAPISLISLVDADRQWFKANTGLPEASETPRDLAFCAHGILGTDVFEVNDATQDERFADNPLVTEAPHIRFYAGAPIRLSTGEAVGTLCVIDRSPRRLQSWQVNILQEMAQAAGQILEMRRERLRASRLDDSVRRLSMVAHLTAHAVLMTDVQGVVTWANNGFVRLSGSALDDLVGKPLEEVMSQAQQESAASVQRLRAYLTAQRHSRSEYSFRSRTGQTHWLDVEAQPLLRADNELEGFLFVASDVTARKETELQLQRAENATREYAERFRVAATIAEIGVWEIDIETGEVVWDHEMRRLYAVPDEVQGDALHALWHDRLHPEDQPQARQIMVESLSSGRDYRTEFRIVLPDGQLRHMRNFARVIQGPDGIPLRMIGVAQDMTAQHQLNATLAQQNLDLQRANQEVQEASRAKGQFLANMSHEIRTPMNAITGMLALLQKTPLDERQQDYVAKADTASRSLLSLINDILDFSKAEAGKIELDPQPLRLEDLLQDVGVVLSMNVGNKPVELLFDVQDGLPAVVIGDALRLQQVLVNLGSNAIKFTERGEVRIVVQSMEHDSESVVLRFAVQDTGIGISPENQVRIFEGFTQAEASTTRRFGGTGLGLVICKHLVGLMGGELGLHSVPGQGSTFEFGVRLFLGDSTAAKRPAATPRRIVLASPSMPVADLLTRQLSTLGHTLVVGANADAAIAHIKGDHFDTVIVDALLPYKEALLLLEHLQSDTDRLHVRQMLLLPHGNSEPVYQLQGQAVVFDARLERSWTPGSLKACLHIAHRLHTASTESPARAPEGPQLSGLRVLVVDDNPVNLQIAAGLLRAEGATVSTAMDGQKAVDAFGTPPDAGRFDVVLMDMQMPVMDGLQATRVLIQTLGADAPPIVAMTANAMAADREACLQAGMVDHLSKPFEVKKMLQLVRRVAGLARE